MVYAVSVLRRGSKLDAVNKFFSLMAAEETEKATSFNPIAFVKGSVEELKKVTYPTRQETTQATLVTLLIIVFVAGCLFVLDLILNQLMLALLS